MKLAAFKLYLPDSDLHVQAQMRQQPYYLLPHQSVLGNRLLAKTKEDEEGDGIHGSSVKPQHQKEVVFRLVEFFRELTNEAEVVVH